MQSHNQKDYFPFGCETAFLRDASQRKYAEVAFLENTKRTGKSQTL